MKKLFSATFIVVSLLGTMAMAEEAYVMQKLETLSRTPTCAEDSTDCLPGAECPIGYQSNVKYCKKKGSHWPWKGWYRCGIVCQEDDSSGD